MYRAYALTFDHSKLSTVPPQSLNNKIAIVLEKI